jgi:hypothetical protein
MARKATASIPFNELKKICAEKGIKSWPEYQKRYTEIAGAKKTLHATYAKEWSGNKAFFVNGSGTAKVETVTAPVAKKEVAKKAVATSKKVIAPKTASNSSKKTTKATAKVETVVAK